MEEHTLSLAERIIRNHFRLFYLAKSLRGKTLSETEIDESFGSSSFTWKFLAYPTGSIETATVKNLKLVDRDLYIELFRPNDINLRWTYTHRMIRGTNLLLVETDVIPWWQLSEFGYNGSIFKDDIEPEDIKPNLKNREGHISYLQLVKKTHISVQMRLPGF